LPLSASTKVRVAGAVVLVGDGVDVEVLVGDAPWAVVVDVVAAESFDRAAAPDESSAGSVVAVGDAGTGDELLTARPAAVTCPRAWCWWVATRTPATASGAAHPSAAARTAILTVSWPDQRDDAMGDN
jgi:hypothetical protein